MTSSSSSVGAGRPGALSRLAVGCARGGNHCSFGLTESVVRTDAWLISAGMGADLRRQGLQGNLVADRCHGTA